MRKLMTGCAVAGAFGALLTGAPPASAQLAQPQTAIGIAAGHDLTTQVQWRRGGYAWRGGGWRGGGWRGGGWRGYGWRGYGYRPYYRPWIGPGIGFATGLAIGGAFAAPYYYAPAPRVYYGAPVVDGAVAYCMRRFKSYDVASGTYLGFDGRRHPCP